MMILISMMSGFKFNDNDGPARLALGEADNNIIALELQLILLLPLFFSVCLRLCLITSSGKPGLVRIGLSALVNLYSK